MTSKYGIYPLLVTTLQLVCCYHNITDEETEAQFGYTGNPEP